MLKMDYARGGGCSGHHGCASYLVVGAVSAASMGVSGSIVIVGNVVYWLEKQGKCLEPDSSAIP